MTLHLLDVAYNNAYDRGPLIDALDKGWAKSRILVPPPYADEVRGLALMLDWKHHFSYTTWFYGSGCFDGWMIVIDPEKDRFFQSGRLMYIEPRS